MRGSTTFLQCAFFPATASDGKAAGAILTERAHDRLGSAAHYVVQKQHGLLAGAVGKSLTQEPSATVEPYGRRFHSCEAAGSRLPGVANPTTVSAAREVHLGNLG